MSKLATSSKVHSSIIMGVGFMILSVQIIKIVLTIQEVATVISSEVVQCRYGGLCVTVCCRVVTSGINA